MRILVVGADRSDPHGVAINLGDAYLTDALLDELRRLGFDADAADFGPGASLRADRIPASGMRGLFAAVAAADLVILGGGTLVQDDVGKGFRGLPRLVAAVSASARVAGTPCVAFAVGAEPVARPIARLYLAAGLLGRTAYVRDQRSFAAVGAFRPRRRLAADACWLSPDRTASSARSGALVALAAKTAKVADEASVRRLGEQTGGIRFVQMSQSGRFSDADALPTVVRGAFQVVTDSLTVPRMWAEFAGVESVAASRLHALYAGALSGCSLAAIGDVGKVRSFAAEFGVPWYPDLHALAHAEGRRFELADPAKIAAARGRVRAALAHVLSGVGGRP